MLWLKHNSLLAVLVIAAASPAFLSTNLTAATAEAPSSIDSKKTILFDNLAHAENEQEGRIAENAIWQFWFNLAPTPEVRQSLDAAIDRREAYDFEAAEKHLDTVVELAPDYAEGYNQRAFIRFLREHYDAAQQDLETALELEPDHFGAMSGLFLVRQKLNSQQAALNILQQAIQINPWLKERHALPEAMWPESYRRVHETGQEI